MGSSLFFFFGIDLLNPGFEVSFFPRGYHRPPYKAGSSLKGNPLFGMERVSVSSDMWRKQCKSLMKCAGLLALNRSSVSKQSDPVVYVTGMTYFLP